MHNRFQFVAILAVLTLSAGNAVAEITISSQPTQNMSCTAGVCSPTAPDATLNIGDLETLLASANVEVTTRGAGVQAKDIKIASPLSWSSTNGLSLRAKLSIIVEKPISVTNIAQLAIRTNDGGSGGLLSFRQRGRIDFANLSSELFIDGAKYALYNSLPKLAEQIVKHPNRAFALVSNYDASQDGTYGSSPIPITFNSAFNGLGHVISRLKIIDDSGSDVGLFSTLGSFASVGGINLREVFIVGSGDAGGVAGSNEGTINNSFVESGIIDGQVSGGIVGRLDASSALIVNCSSDVLVRGQNGAGGLAGFNQGSIESSYALGATKPDSGTVPYLGGLVGLNSGGDSERGVIANSYAMGKVTKGGAIGGFVGYNPSNSSIETSYSTGPVTGVKNPAGFVGVNDGTAQNSYWDTTTSGDANGVGSGNTSGVTGLTTQQLQSGLPSGFDPKIWAEKPSINNGFPYLISNPPTVK